MASTNIALAVVALPKTHFLCNFDPAGTIDPSLERNRDPTMSSTKRANMGRPSKPPKTVSVTEMATRKNCHQFITGIIRTKHTNTF
jgi:hypothetical protein